MPITSASTGITVKRPMPAKRSSSAASNALPALPVIKPVRLLRRSAATALTGRPMFAMAARNRSIIAPLFKNIQFTVPDTTVVRHSKISEEFFKQLALDGYTVSFRTQLSNKKVKQIIEEVMT